MQLVVGFSPSWIEREINLLQLPMPTHLPQTTLELTNLIKGDSEYFKPRWQIINILHLIMIKMHLLNIVIITIIQKR